MNNYFRVWGVKSNASENDIKKAYRRLSNQYHPPVKKRKSRQPSSCTR